MTEPKDYIQDEIIEVKLPRKDYELFREMIERERAYNWFRRQVRSFWVWTLVGGIVSALTLWNLGSSILKGIK